MPQYKAPLRDIRFVLYELLDVEKHYARLPGATDLNRELVDAMLGEAAKLIEGVVAPLNRSGDEEGCTWTPEGVTTPKGFKEAYKKYCEAGFTSIAADPEYGGQGLPPSLGLCISEMASSANNSFCMYPGLTNGAIACITAHGTPDQKNTYLPKLITGEWSGTMCLTEAHCGTDLGLLRTKAVPSGDGVYDITGEKIFISAGEHDMSENIIHLVLARLPDAPAGTKGISLFIVPKLMPKDGGVGERNAVKCGSIEHKMGIKASATCVMVFEDAKGYLVGEPHKGLKAMFTMMNVARIGTGMQGMAQGEASFQGALAYARDRLQMRSLTGPKAPDKPADPIIVHPDVRRMLLTQKAFAEGSRALAYFLGTLADVTYRMPADSEEAKQCEKMLELLTPICKGFMTDTGFESANLGMQVLGGHGYIREHGMEQLARDGRILQQYEGANGIQSLDLLGRKVLANGGATLRLFTDQIEAFCAQHENKQELAPMLTALKQHTKEWHELVGNILERAIKNPDEAGGSSYDFMSYSGYVTFAFMFARMAAVSLDKLSKGSQDADFYKAKLHTARFYFDRILPRTRGLVVTMKASSSNLMDLADAHFAF